jgi:hypothetical protein
VPVKTLQAQLLVAHRVLNTILARVKPVLHGSFNHSKVSANHCPKLLHQCVFMVLSGALSGVFVLLCVLQTACCMASG